MFVRFIAKFSQTKTLHSLQVRTTQGFYARTLFTQ